MGRYSDIRYGYSTIRASLNYSDYHLLGRPCLPGSEQAKALNSSPIRQAGCSARAHRKLVTSGESKCDANGIVRKKKNPCQFLYDWLG
jgi:hypothetical protein